MWLAIEGRRFVRMCICVCVCVCVCVVRKLLGRRGTDERLLGRMRSRSSPCGGRAIVWAGWRMDGLDRRRKLGTTGKL